MHIGLKQELLASTRLFCLEMGLFCHLYRTRFERFLASTRLFWLRISRTGHDLDTGFFASTRLFWLKHSWDCFWRGFFASTRLFGFNIFGTVFGACLSAFWLILGCEDRLSQCLKTVLLTYSIWTEPWGQILTNCGDCLGQ